MSYERAYKNEKIRSLITIWTIILGGLWGIIRIEYPVKPFISILIFFGVILWATYFSIDGMRYRAFRKADRISRRPR